MIKQQNHNPFANRQTFDRYELTLLSEDGSEMVYRYCTSYRQTTDGRVLMQRMSTGRKAKCATPPKYAKRFQILRVRDFLS
jgi:hypothetical protein